MPRSLFLLAAALPLCAADVAPRARKLHDAAFVFDAHVHVVNRQFYHGGDIGQRVADGQFDLPRAKDGGVDAMFFSLFVTEDYYPQRFETKQVLRLVDLALAQIERNRDTIELARNASDIERINKRGQDRRRARSRGRLRSRRRSRRAAQPLSARAAFGAASGAQLGEQFRRSPAARHPKFKGLNERGRAVVREMNRLGMVINVSHASDATIAQTVELSTAPVVATHHGMRTLNNIPRNMPDELMRKIAAKGGVIGFQIGNEFHNVKAFDWRTKKAGKPFWDTTEIAKREAAPGDRGDRQEGRAAVPDGRAEHARRMLIFAVDDWIGVIEKAIAIVGEDHVALGSDFDGGPTPPRGMRDISDLPMLTDAMLRRGWSEQRIRKFLGGNLLRVFRRITENK